MLSQQGVFFLFFAFVGDNHPARMAATIECRQAAIPSTSPLPLLHEGGWWANATRNFNFKHPDDLDAAAFNRVLWRGTMGEETPYPVDREKRLTSTETRSSKGA